MWGMRWNREVTPSVGMLLRVVADLRRAFHNGGVELLHREHLNARSDCFSYRCLYGLANVLLPINPLFDIVKDIDRQVASHGVAGGSAAALNRFPIPWERELSPEGLALANGSSCAIVYGKHGSVLTPLLVAAGLGRSDTKMIAANYIARLGPHIGACTFPVFPSAPLSVRSAGRKGIIPRVMGWIACRLDPPVERTEAKSRNCEALKRATSHVREGGALLIAPDPRETGAAWRPGIGVIVSSLAQDQPYPCDATLIPYRIWNASITGIFQLLSRNPLLRALGRRRFRRPIRIVFGPPMRIRDVVERAGLDPSRITAYLEEHYQALGY